MGTIKDRNVMNPTEARIQRRTIQKDLHDPDNLDGMITHLEPDILEFEVNGS